jgi:PGF-CTERM protein
MLIAVSAAATATVTAQEVEREILFEDNVTVGNETTITYHSVIEESPAEVEADIDLTLFVDDEEVGSTTITREILDGTEIRVNFTHTFESAGERRVRVDTVTRALGTEIEGGTQDTVNVSAAETDRETGNMTDTGAGNETDEQMDDAMDETSDEGMGEDGNETENETDDGGGEGQGLPGFTPLVALVSLVAGAVYVRRRG